MLTRLRCRLSCEGGISLVETLVAMMILSISMLAMLNTLVGSAHATLSQRARAAGTRVATAEIERLRSVVWEPGFTAPAADTPVSSDGRTFYVTSTVTDDPSVPQLKQVVTQVRWDDGAVSRTQTLQTSVTSGEAATDTLATGAYLTVALAPNPVRVYQNTCVTGYWCPGAPLDVTASVEGIDYTGQIQLAWTGSDGVARSLLLSKTGDTWTGQVPRADVLVTFPDPAFLERDMVFTVTAPSMPSLPAATYTLAMLGYDDVALSANVTNHGTSDPVRRAQIRVDWRNNVHECGTDACKNLDNITLWIGNVDPGATSVVVTWTQPASQSLTLVKYNSSAWYASVPTGSQSRRWYPGPAGTTLNQLPVVATVYKNTTVLMQATLAVPVWTQR